MAFENPISLAYLLLFLTEIFLSAPLPPTPLTPQSPHALHGHPDVLLMLAVGTLCQVGSPWTPPLALEVRLGFIFVGQASVQKHPLQQPPGLRQVPARQRLFSSTGRAVRFQLNRFGRVYFTFSGYANITLRAIWLEHTGPPNHPVRITERDWKSSGFHIDHAQLMQHTSTIMLLPRGNDQVPGDGL